MNTNNNNSTSNMVPIVNREFYDKYLNAEWKRKLEAIQQQRDKINKGYKHLLLQLQQQKLTIILKNCVKAKKKREIVMGASNNILSITAATPSGNGNDLALVSTKFFDCFCECFYSCFYDCFLYINVLFLLSVMMKLVIMRMKVRIIVFMIMF